MTYPQVLAMMQALAETFETEGDHEHAHLAADELLCTFLRDSGFGELIEQYDRIGKWYA